MLYANSQDAWIWSPANIMKMFVAAADKKKKDDIVVNDLPLEENLNRMETENEARTVEEAISVLRYRIGSNRAPGGLSRGRRGLY